MGKNWKFCKFCIIKLHYFTSEFQTFLQMLLWWTDTFFIFARETQIALLILLLLDWREKKIGFELDLDNNKTIMEFSIKVQDFTRRITWHYYFHDSLFLAKKLRLRMGHVPAIKPALNCSHPSALSRWTRCSRKITSSMETCVAHFFQNINMYT